MFKLHDIRPGSFYTRFIWVFGKATCVFRAGKLTCDWYTIPPFNSDRQSMKTFAQIAEEIAPSITEMMPWDVEEFLAEHSDALVVDIRETHEYDTMHIAGSLNVPRGILENACEWDFEETEPELVEARSRPVVLVCRSGNRTALGAYTLQQMGYDQVVSLKTGLRGWNDYELPLVDIEEKPVDIADADRYFANKVLPEQRSPASRPRG